MTTRKDLYLKKLKDNDVNIPTPTTEEEKILAELAGANGLGIELPTVSDADNGKVLKVENGHWVLGEGSGGGGSDTVFIHMIEREGLSQRSDITVEEAWEAVRAGKRLCYVLTQEYVDTDYEQRTIYYSPLVNVDYYFENGIESYSFGFGYGTSLINTDEDEYLHYAD